jgi:putative PIN family toxin of toxin-antitoxin system
VLRVVLDTNVLISAILFGGKPRQILEKAIRGEIRLCLSEPILEELKGVLQRSKFDYSPEMIQFILTELMGIADFVSSLWQSYMKGFIAQQILQATRRP